MSLINITKIEELLIYRSELFSPKTTDPNERQQWNSVLIIAIKQHYQVCVFDELFHIGFQHTQFYRSIFH